MITVLGTYLVFNEWMNGESMKMNMDVGMDKFVDEGWEAKGNEFSEFLSVIVKS